MLRQTKGPRPRTPNKASLEQIPQAIPKLDKYIQSKSNSERLALGLRTERIVDMKDYLGAWRKDWDILEKKNRKREILDQK